MLGIDEANALADATGLVRVAYEDTQAALADEVFTQLCDGISDMLAAHHADNREWNLVPESEMREFLAGVYRAMELARH
jgi:hypothetical protein